MRQEENPFPKFFSALVSRLPDYLMYGGAGLLVLDQFMRSTFGHAFLDPTDLRISVMVFTVVLFVTVTNRRLAEVNATLGEIKLSQNRDLNIIQENERPQLIELLSKCDHVRILTLSGTKTIPLGDDRFVEAILHPSRRARVTILLGDPYSSAIRDRYDHDEPLSYESGIAGIERRIRQFSDLLSAAPSESKFNIEIRLFNSYPTLSLLWADNEIYATSYGFKLRGSDCPQVHSSISNEYGQFLSKHFSKMYESAIPLSAWMTRQSGGG